MLEQFIPAVQLAILQDKKLEEAAYYQDVLKHLTNTFITMPKTYQTDEQGDNAIAYLHYFTGCADAWIVEKDKCYEQYQAFGLIDLGIGTGRELGYISIKELIENGFEIDLYWEATAIKHLK